MQVPTYMCLSVYVYIDVRGHPQMLFLSWYPSVSASLCTKTGIKSVHLHNWYFYVSWGYLTLGPCVYRTDAILPRGLTRPCVQCYTYLESSCDKKLPEYSSRHIPVILCSCLLMVIFHNASGSLSVTARKWKKWCCITPQDYKMTVMVGGCATAPSKAKVRVVRAWEYVSQPPYEKSSKLAETMAAAPIMPGTGNILLSWHLLLVLCNCVG